MKGEQNERDAAAATTATAAARLLAEALGTFALVFAGTGAIVVDGLTGGSLGHLGIAMTFGLVIGVMVYALRETSGAHFNPAVTLAMVLDRRFSPARAGAYILAQTSGALAGTGLLILALKGEGVAAWGATVPAYSAAAAFVFELISTFLLVTVILGVVRAEGRANAFAGLAIGGTIALCALFAGPISGASMNPARSLSPALFTAGAMASYWIYLLAPLAGGALAVAAHRILARQM
mgnify:CR=1 FL=1